MFGVADQEGGRHDVGQGFGGEIAADRGERVGLAGIRRGWM